MTTTKKTKSKTLKLTITAAQYDQIRNGTTLVALVKPTSALNKRLSSGDFTALHLATRRANSPALVKPFAGYELTTVTHEDFGPSPVEVLAFHLTTKAA